MAIHTTTDTLTPTSGLGAGITTPGAFNKVSASWHFPTFSGSNTMTLGFDLWFDGSGIWVAGINNVSISASQIDNRFTLFQDGFICKGIRPNMNFNGNTGSVIVQIVLED